MALLGIPWHSSAFFCIPRHSSGFLFIPLHSLAFFCIPLQFSAFLGIPLLSFAFLGIPTHFKAFQDFLRHSKAFLGLPRVIQGVPMGSNGFQGRSSKVILRRPKSSKDVQSRPKTSKVTPKGSNGFQGFQVVQPVLEWRRGAMRRDLRVGTYAFGGATPGDQRVLAALGAGRRPAASKLIIFRCLKFPKYL